MSQDEQALLSQLLEQEQTIQFEEFGSETALAIGLRLVDAARNAGKAIMVDIRRDEVQLFQHAMHGTGADNADWIRRKNNVVRHSQHSSFYAGNYYRSSGTTFEEYWQLDPRDYAAHGGAFPLLLKGAGVVGTITVSGLPQADDHALVVSVLETFLNMKGATPTELSSPQLTPGAEIR